MNRQNWILAVVVCLMIAGAGGVMARIKSSQKLGAPGVRTTAIVGSNRLKVEVPAGISGYTSEWMDVDDLTRQSLPKDTSFGQRRYTGSDGFETVANVVLMGGDRSSLHKPQFCLTGQGWVIDNDASSADVLPISEGGSYNLPVVKLVATKELNQNGQRVKYRGLYVYWYVADGVVSASTTGLQRMWWMATDLLRTGVLQRWAYVSYFSVCQPGQEEATFERMKSLIKVTVPKFQNPPKEAQVAGR